MSQIFKKVSGTERQALRSASNCPFYYSTDKMMRGITVLSQRGQKRSACHYDKRLDLHQLFEQILYIPLIVFSFPHQPTDTVCLIPLLQKLGERPIECGLPTSITPRFCCMVSAALRIDSPSEKRFRKRSA